jgi:TonB-dependent SusC/RagA subfamily outer membrane receptor
MKSIATIAIAMLCTMAVHSQTRVIHGQLSIFDTYTLQNVEITSQKANATTMTDSLGQFSIVCEENDVIRIKTKLFKQSKVKVGPDTETLLVDVQFIDSPRNRKLAVGYGYITEAELNYGISCLEQKNNDFCSYATIYDLIRGRLSGVTVLNNNIYVRGGKNSFTPEATIALYVVDNQPISDIDWIQPCQVKSISILKDSNAAIYGVRGGNGVVLIDTMK